MSKQHLHKEANYGAAFEGTSSVDALMKLIPILNQFDVDDLLILPYLVHDNPKALTTRLDALSLEGFQGTVVISILGISHTDDALFACLNLRDALDYPELVTVVATSSERKANLSKVLAIAGFSDLPSQSPRNINQ